MTEKIYCEFYLKKCYTKREAQEVINKARNPENYFNKGQKKRRSNKIHRNKIPRRIYYCKYCGYWHTTSQLSNRNPYND